MADVLPITTDSPARAELTPAGIARLDVPLPVVEASVHLADLLAHPPLGHVEELQPGEWYEAVFDDMATAYNARRNTGGQS
ncbi:hypothetical protein ACFVYT_24675 [Streptomyces sp. NPDC058290]|uniref:hypothetical protein n=1 Tax=Streptomyces sp. NPDC058290 TaxID=3346426 RepID=UPI0036E18ED0